MAEAQALELTVEGITVAVSHPDKVLFGQSGITKGDLARYYATVGPTIAAVAGQRATTLVRYPNGLDGESFFQKNTPKHYPDWIPRVEVAKKGGVVRHCVIDHPATLVYFAQQNVITPHIGLASVGDLARPDLFVIDLDPSVDDADQLRRIAFGVKEALERAGLVPFVQLTGSKGLHVVAPLVPSAGWAEAQRFGQALSTLLLDTFPDDLTMEFSKAERGDRMYLDMGRNNHQATFAAPYGVRAYEGAPVVTPIEWSELDDPDLTPRHFTIDTIPERLTERGDPWAELTAAARPLPG